LPHDGWTLTLQAFLTSTHNDAAKELRSCPIGTSALLLLDAQIAGSVRAPRPESRVLARRYVCSRSVREDRPSTRQVEGSLLGLRSHGVGARAYDVVCVDTDRQVVGNLARTPGFGSRGSLMPGFWCCSGAPALDREQVLDLLEQHVQALRELRRRDDRGC
jgi:hypothetical protein